MPNPWWRTPTHPARWCCSMPTRSVNPFKYCQYFYFFSAPYFAPLPFMDRCYFTPFFHTVAVPRDRSRAPLPERPLQTPGSAGLSGGPSNFQAPTSFLPQKTFTDIFLLASLPYTPYIVSKAAPDPSSLSLLQVKASRVPPSPRARSGPGPSKTFREPLGLASRGPAIGSFLLSRKVSPSSTARSICLPTNFA